MQLDARPAAAVSIEARDRPPPNLGMVFIPGGTFRMGSNRLVQYAS
jgi:formylglycine-generating enzyme required for sulfatase activity